MNAPMITKNQANRSITQLLCLILGGEKSKASAHFASDPLNCIGLTHQEDITLNGKESEFFIPVKYQ